ncbi:VirB6/TrbL-like conjugal transfer protein, CD1112 family [Gudongella sp. SC589]|uniref:VirB6/TrbL-like conjugal transfer protein, CD1112 family n=1 Tax=Gudongella sp. SC589 TaxID=3385990 RepID=UPI0039049237
MFGLWENLTEWIKELLLGVIQNNLENMFADVNEKIGTIATEVGTTPQGWNSDVFNVIQSLSENVIVPIAGLVITFVLCYELIIMITDRNNLHDIDTWIFFKWIFKAFIAVTIVSNTWNIVMATFDVAQHMVNQASGVISSEASIDISSNIESMMLGIEEMEISALLGLMLETTIARFAMNAISILITVILYGRMIEIYLVSSVAPIPMATLANKEWGQTGTNYFKGLFALAIQAFFIMVCVGIYAVLIRTLTVTDNIHASILMILTYTVLLCFSLFKTGSLARSVLNTH